MIFELISRHCLPRVIGFADLRFRFNPFRIYRQGISDFNSSVKLFIFCFIILIFVYFFCKPISGLDTFYHPGGVFRE